MKRAAATLAAKIKQASYACAVLQTARRGALRSAPSPSPSTHTRSRISHLFVLMLLMLLATQQQTLAQICGTPGKDGPGGTLTGVINTYYPGAASVAAGATTISLGTPSGAPNTIAVGDLLLVIQMQDASIDTDNNDSYGDGAPGGAASGTNGIGGSGRYEYVLATTAGGATVGIRGVGANNGLVNAYNHAATASTVRGQRRFQVVRVPQYSSATLSSSLTALRWNGTIGGILALDVAGEVDIAGASINLDGYGFRGGGAVQLAGSNNGGANTDYRNLSTNPFHGSKGEGIVGTPRYVYEVSTNTVVNTGVEGYPSGSFARGAPGNAGGGGTDGNIRANDENSGGGGGSNGGTGGVGGNTWNSNLARGGYGGTPFGIASATRLILGGGGGAGSRNNSTGSASSGGSGGGIVMMRVGIFSGSGSISANGTDGVEPQNDGGGGGGAGGSVLVGTANGGTTGWNISVRGGNGSDADISGSPHGPGGGGGGGIIAATGAVGSGNTTGGFHGLTSGASSAYGSTDGGSGQTLNIGLAQIIGVRAGSQCLPDLSVTKTTSTATVNNTSSGVTATYTIVVANAGTRATAMNLSISDTLPANFTYASTGTVTLTGTATRSTTSNPTAGNAVPVWGVFNIPASSSVSLTFTVNIAAGTNGIKQNPATITYTDPERTTVNGTTTASYDPASSTGEDVNVIGPPNVVLCKTIVGQPCPPPVLPAQLPGTEVTYIINFTNDGGRAASTLIIADKIPPNTAFKLGSIVYSAGTTGLAAPIVEYTTQARNPAVETPPSPWVNYTPGGANGTYDAQITYVRFRFTSGNLNVNTSGSISFTVRIL